MKLKMFTLAALVLMCMSFTAGGRPSARYLPPTFTGSASSGHSGYGRAAVAARPSNQYLAPQASSVQYQGMSGSGDGGDGHFGGVRGSGHFGAAGGGGHFGSSGASAYGSRGHSRSGAQIPILRNDYSNDGQGNYNFGFETGNGIRRDETGNFEGGWPHGSLDVKGSYSYTGDDGRTYTVNYRADKNGFHAEGDHLPTPPPVPRQIQESQALHHRGAHAGSYGHSHGSGHGGGAHAAHSYAAYGNHAAASDHIPSTRYLPPKRRTRYTRRHF